MNLREAAIAMLFVGASLAHSIAGFFVPALPAWKMFDRIDRVEFTVTDRDGHLINVHEEIPERAYVIHPYAAKFVAHRLAEKYGSPSSEKQLHRGPILLTVTNWHRVKTPQGRIQRPETTTYRLDLDRDGNVESTEQKSSDVRSASKRS